MYRDGTPISAFLRRLYGSTALWEAGANSVGKGGTSAASRSSCCTKRREEWATRPKISTGGTVTRHGTGSQRQRDSDGGSEQVAVTVRLPRKLGWWIMIDR